jgi:hypothetical protein
VLDLRCPARAVIFYVVCGLITVGPVLTFFLAGWNDTREQTILLALLGFVFALCPVHGLQQRVQVSRGAIRTRYFGWWRTTELSRSVRFKRLPDRKRYAGLARTLLSAPPSIGAMDPSGRKMAEIGFDMLAGMGKAEYSALLGRLNRGH